ncbi:phage tail tape measure protein [Allorhizobium taibaishanense]|uniref:Phage tail tape measure protein n=1 Tax=Allorhizobium taibaishanense TaxID=887144 RepID=A0A1Q9A2N9_9HYPH|nr:phage tail tape measure protein [Allorhizobium taibaishanense]MBB4005795.1 TP901 family phage tail tape measure protein [Allorhizobium taibaishanense]OLP48844.1 phage tail tape measure protein [Allorhizobium taibaishanense]
MSKLQASLVVDLVDKTGAKTSAVIGNMNRLQKAERDYMLSSKGLRLSNKDRAMERLLTERQAELEARAAKAKEAAALRSERHNAILARGTVAAVAVGVAAGKAYSDFASLERRVNRIVINADKGADAIQPTIGKMQDVAADAHMAFGDVVEGLETLVSSGRTLDEAMAFLPAVTTTAQASGAAVSDMALSADSLAGSLKINAKDMQHAFDILVAGGKAGKFELKDMARELPSLLPAFAALGYKGTEGLEKMVAMLQVLRNQTGTSGEAATNLANIMQKMYSADTAAKFKKFGIDLPKALDKARKSGRDVIDVLLDMSTVATKGDLSKLSLLFPDAQMQAGVRGLISQREEMKKLNAELKNVDGSTLRDFNQVVGDSAAKIQDLSNNWDRFVKNVGSGVAVVANPTLGYLNSAIESARNQMKSQEGKTEEQRRTEAKTYKDAYRARNPDAWWFQVNDAYMNATARVGAGTQSSVMDDFKNHPVYGNQYNHFRKPAAAPVTNPDDLARQQSLDSFLAGPDKLPQVGAAISEKIVEGGGAAGKAAADNMQSQASAVGNAIGSAFLSRISGALGAFMANPGGGMPRSTGQALQQQTNGQFVDQP